jgi:hypothetical protein
LSGCKRSLGVVGVSHCPQPVVISYCRAALVMV